MVQPEAEERCELVIVGAGLAALHLAARLPENLLKDTVVIDPSGAWLASCAARCARLGTLHMRTPATQHPHASPLALQTWAEKQGRQQELVPVVKGFAPVPTAPLLLDFCAAKVVRKLPAAPRAPLADRAVRIERLSGDAGSGCRVHLASGRVLAARAAVYTPANRSPVLPAWARQLLAERAGQDGGEPQAQLPPGIATADAVDLRSAELAGSSAVVVGGGMSAGLLAAGAAERGAQVTLVCRRPLQPQPFETDVGWWGAKQLGGYRQLESAELRLAACRRARRQGSVHLPLWRRLAAAAAAGRLTVLEGWEVAGAHQAEGAEGAATKGPAWLLHLQRREGALPAAAGPTLFQQAVAAAAAAAASAPDALAEQQFDEQPAELTANLVWLACGRAYDAAGEAVLRQLAAQAPVPRTGGYPWLDDEALCWPGAPVYLLGRGALLSVGPCAGDMPGMRLAADRVAASLRRLDFAGAPVWQAARGRLAARLLGSPQGGAISGAAAAEDGSVDAEQLAVAVAAAQAAAAHVLLEAEGLAWEEPKPKALVSRPAHLIDVSDLDPALPRREVQRYKFTDDGFEICVICQLDEPVPLGQVRTLFGPQHLEMWAVGAGAAHRLHLPRLYGRVLPKKCGVRVNEKARKVYVLLHKEADAEWRFLKG